MLPPVILHLFLSPSGGPYRAPLCRGGARESLAGLADLAAVEVACAGSNRSTLRAPAHCGWLSWAGLFGFRLWLASSDAFGWISAWISAGFRLDFGLDLASA